MSILYRLYRTYLRVTRVKKGITGKIAPIVSLRSTRILHSRFCFSLPALSCSKIDAPFSCPMILQSSLASLIQVVKRQRYLRMRDDMSTVFLAHRRGVWFAGPNCVAGEIPRRRFLSNCDAEKHAKNHLGKNGLFHGWGHSKKQKGECQRAIFIVADSGVERKSRICRCAG